MCHTWSLDELLCTHAWGCWSTIFHARANMGCPRNHSLHGFVLQQAGKLLALSQGDLKTEVNHTSHVIMQVVDVKSGLFTTYSCSCRLCLNERMTCSACVHKCMTCSCSLQKPNCVYARHAQEFVKHHLPIFVVLAMFIIAAAALRRARPVSACRPRAPTMQNLSWAVLHHSRYAGVFHSHLVLR